MAISTSRVDVSTIKESVKTSLTTGSASNPLDFQSIADKATEAVSTAQGKVTSLVSSAQNTIDSALSGVASKTESILGNGFIKNLSFSTKSLGFFENILCGKLPSLNLRLSLPKIKLDFNTNIKLTWNVEICGKSKQVNPLDAAFTVVNAIQNPKGFIDDTKETIINKLLDKGGQQLLNKLGMSKLGDCIRDSVKSNLYDAYSEDGMTLKDKLAMFDSTTTPDCTGDLLQDVLLQANVNNKIAGAIFGKISSLGDHTLVQQVLSRIIVSDESLVINGLSDMLKWPTYNSNPKTSNYLSNQLKAIHGVFGSKQAFYTIISMQDGYRAQGLNAVTYSQAEMIHMQSKGSYILDRLAQESTPTGTDDSTFESVVTTLNILDPNWTIDTDGKVAMYRAQDNENVKKLAESYLESKMDKYKNYDFTTNKVTTQLDMADHIVINNKFDSETYEKVLIRY